MKTLNQFVRSECCNCQQGNCILRKDRICPTLSGEACPVPSRWWAGASPRNPEASFFESAVLPLADKAPEYAEAANEYRALIGLRSKVVRLCQCGQPLPKRGRMCTACTKKTRAAEAKEKRRLKRTKLTTFSAL